MEVERGGAGSIIGRGDRVSVGGSGDATYGEKGCGSDGVSVSCTSVFNGNGATSLLNRKDM